MIVGSTPAKEITKEITVEITVTVYTIRSLSPDKSKLSPYSTPYSTHIPPYSTIFAAGLIMDAAGNLYGTTGGGGIRGPRGTTGGVVFELTPNATKTAWTEMVLHSFRFCPHRNCRDGGNPVAPLIMDAAGNLYGTTQSGGFSKVRSSS